MHSPQDFQGAQTWHQASPKSSLVLSRLVLGPEAPSGADRVGRRGAFGPGRAGRARRLVFVLIVCKYFVYLLIYFVYILIYFYIFWHILLYFAIFC